MNHEEQCRMWDRIHRENPTIPQSNKRKELARLLAYHNAKPKEHIGPLYASKKSTKSRAKACGQILADSCIKSSSISNPPLRGTYVSVPTIDTSLTKEEKAENALMKKCVKVKPSHNPYSAGELILTLSETKDSHARQQHHIKQ